MISSESYELTTRDQQQQVQQIRSKLESKIHKQLVDSLVLLSNPEHILDDWIERVIDRLARLTSEADKKQYLQSEFAFLQRQFINNAGDAGAEQIRMSVFLWISLVH